MLKMQQVPLIVPISNNGLTQPTSVRIISPSQIQTLAKQSQPQSEPLSEFPRDNISQANLIDEEIMKQDMTSQTWLHKLKYWLFQKDFLKIYNLIWIMFAAAMSLAIIITTICFTVIYCRQINADITATTLQSGLY